MGATFAYFSVTLSQDSTTTTITGKTPQISTLALDNASTSLDLTLTAEDMANTTEAKTKYYAVAEGKTNESQNGGKWAKTSANYEASLGGVTLTTTGNDEYTCTYVITVAPDESADTMVEVLKEGEAKLTVTGPGITDGTDFDLKGLYTEGAKTSKTFNGSETLSSSTTSMAYKAYVYIENTAENQNHLSDKTLKLNITAKATCNPKEAE